MRRLRTKNRQKIARKTSFFQLITNLFGKRVAVRFPYRCSLDFGRVAFFCTSHGADELGSAFFCNCHFCFNIVYRIDDHIVWTKIEIFYPVIIDFGINFFNTGIEAFENFYLYFSCMFAAYLTVLVGDIVTIEVNDGDIAHSRAVEAIKSEAPHTSDPEYQYFRFAYGIEALSKKRPAALKPHSHRLKFSISS